MSARRRTTDSERLTRWVREHGGALRGFLLARTGREEVADDLLQEVFQRAWQARRRYAETGAARAYLMRIADRLVVDWSRDRGREAVMGRDDWQRLPLADEGPSPLDALSAEEAQRQLAEAMQQLSEPQQRVLLLRYYGEMPFAQIAGILGCPLNTVLSHCRRGLLALRKRLVEVV